MLKKTKACAPTSARSIARSFKAKQSFSMETSLRMYIFFMNMFDKHVMLPASCVVRRSPLDIYL